MASPVAQFGAAALNGLGAASTARVGEAAAEAEEREPRKERSRKIRAQRVPARGGKLRCKRGDLRFAVRRRPGLYLASKISFIISMRAWG